MALYILIGALVWISEQVEMNSLTNTIPLCKKYSMWDCLIS